MKQTNLPFFIAERPESNDIEFKSCSEGRLPKDIWKTISAFSNTDGGQIILGIDPNGNPLNLDRKEIDKLQTDIASICSQSFNAPIAPEIQYKSSLLIIHIPPQPAQLRPIYLKRKGTYSGTYIRIGSSNHQATDADIRRFSMASAGGAEVIVYPGVLYSEVFDESLIKGYIEVLNKKHNNIYQSFTDEEILLKLKAINKSLQPTLFGVLCFGKILTQNELIAPSINITVTQYPGYEKVNPEDPSETYIDNKEFIGDVVSQFKNALLFIKSRLPSRGIVDDRGIRNDIIVIPEIALREALANSVAHRDYADHSSSIQVDIFSDRVEITNPGKSIVPIKELEYSPSVSRNPLLMSYLKDHGITEQKARGIRTIITSIRNAGLAKPEFSNMASSFKSTLYATIYKSPEDKVWLDKYTKHKLNSRQKNALIYIKNNSNGISNREYREINSINQVRDDKKANKELKQLVDLGVVRQVGENRARRYIIND